MITNHDSMDTSTHPQIDLTLDPPSADETRIDSQYQIPERDKRERKNKGFLECQEEVGN